MSKRPVSEDIVRWPINNAFPFTIVSIITDTLACLINRTLPDILIFQRYDHARLDTNVIISVELADPLLRSVVSEDSE